VYRNSFGPEYLMDYGAHYYDVFTRKLEWAGNPAVFDVFILRARANLHEEFLDILTNDFSVYNSRQALYEAAMSSHYRAYIDAGWLDLDIPEMMMVGWGVRPGDLFNVESAASMRVFLKLLHVGIRASE